MADTFKFPNGGFDVTICKKQDIINCIENNIVDKDIALAIVEQCELDIANFIREGKWTGIPYIGNVRVPKSKLLESTPEQQLLIEEAKETLNPKDYILFRKQLNGENCKRVKQETYYKYILSIAINRNRKLYRKLCKEKGEVYARIYLYSSKSITSTDNEFLIKDNYE